MEIISSLICNEKKKKKKRKISLNEIQQVKTSV